MGQFSMEKPALKGQFSVEINNFSPLDPAHVAVASICSMNVNGPDRPYSLIALNVLDV
jgi:hypothetical protein